MPGVVAHASNPSIQEAEAERVMMSLRPACAMEFKANLNYRAKASLKKLKSTQIKNHLNQISIITREATLF